MWITSYAIEGRYVPPDAVSGPTAGDGSLPFDSKARFKSAEELSTHVSWLTGWNPKAILSCKIFLVREERTVIPMTVSDLLSLTVARNATRGAKEI